MPANQLLCHPPLSLHLPKYILDVWTGPENDRGGFIRMEEMD